MQRCIAAGSVVWGWPALAWQEGPSEHGMLPVLCGECELVHERERALSPPSPSCAGIQEEELIWMQVCRS